MRPFSCVPALILLLLTAGLARAQQSVMADTRQLDFKEFGLLAIQDNGRRKPIDTFVRQTLIQLTGRSSFTDKAGRSEEHTSELQSHSDLVCRLLLEKKKRSLQKH